MEIWKVISDAPMYKISNFGNVLSLKTNKPISKIVNNKNKPYLRVGLMVNSVRVFFLVHRIVAKEFISNPYNYTQVNHIDENKQNNRADNLEWCNNKQNSRHSNLKQLIQIDNDGQIVKTFKSLFEAGDAGWHKGSISRCATGIRDMHKVFKWQYIK